MKRELTDAQRVELERLSKELHEPVLPLSHFCHAMTTWFHCIEQANERAKVEGRGAHGEAYAEHLGRIELDIRKSNLLARLLYGGESLRSRECPQHKGRWSGIGVCEHGCGETGWIPDGWPDDAPRCTRHPERPAVGVFASVKERRHVCFECWNERWAA